MSRSRLLPAGFGAILAVAARPALAQVTPIAITAAHAGGGTTYSVPVQTLIFLTALGFLPALLLLTTAFTRIVIVLSLLRMALGTQTAPPNQVLIGLALFLTFFVMGPTFDRVYDTAYVPFREQKMSFEQAAQAAAVPMKDFMIKHTRPDDLALFVRMARLDKEAAAAKSLTDLPIRVVIPAFATSELKTAFQIGFMIFIPFLVIDMVVSSVLMSMGMMMLSPVLVSTPIKLMLFVLANGWDLLIGSLVASFGN